MGIFGDDALKQQALLRFAGNDAVAGRFALLARFARECSSVSRRNGLVWFCESGPWQAKQLFERIGRTCVLKEIFSPAKASAFAGAGAESVDEVAGLASGGLGVSDGLPDSLQEARKSIGITVSKIVFLNMP